MTISENFPNHALGHRLRPYKAFYSLQNYLDICPEQKTQVVAPYTLLQGGHCGEMYSLYLADIEVSQG